MTTQNTNRLKTNYDLLEAQQQAFSNGGVVLKNIFGISAKHPFLSLIFVISFTLLINFLYELIAFLTAKSEFSLTMLLLLIALFALIPIWVILRIVSLHRDLFIATPIDQKKVLLTLVSPRTNYKETPTYAVIEAVLYNVGRYAAPNSLQKVILITSESQDAGSTANTLKTYIENTGRLAEIKGITINNRTLMEIQKQMELILVEVRKNNKPHEIVTDYTGATKDMSIALLKASEKELILPIYLNDATATNHSKYT